MSLLDDLRRQIDSIDDALLKLLNERAEIALRIGKLKSRENRNFHAPSREKEVLERLEDVNPGPLPKEALRAVYREIMSASLALEEPVKVAYLGPAGTFSHLACLKEYGSSARFYPVKSFSEVFEEVERGRVHYGVVPIENSIEGAVNNTLDRLIESDLTITSEILLKVSHYLMSLSGEMERVRKVYSHPQPTAQCRQWIEKHIPQLPIIEAESTASAAQRAAEDPEGAAIAGEAAVRFYGLKVIEKSIEDNVHNVTRFLTVSKEMAERTGYDKTSIVFAFKNEPGALFKILRPFADKGINLTKIESRPSGKKAWEYVFFVDMEGHVEDLPVREALELLQDQSFFLKILGSYPRARNEDRKTVG
jgi:chorismate mutase/prephenate dehydratase